MVKIKRKVEKNLPQLIEWAWENPELSQYKMFEKIGATMRDYVSFNNEENGVRLNGTVKPTDLFTVEVEEEITEDTVLPEILLIANDGLFIESHDNSSINDVLSTNEGHFEERLMIILKPEPTIIWTCEKGLVE